MRAAMKQVDRRNAHITLSVNCEDFDVSLAPHRTLLEGPAS